MTPRWTIDGEVHPLLAFRVDHRTAHVGPTDLRVLGSHSLQDRLTFSAIAFDVLVAAVRDADTLRQARELATDLLSRRAHGTGGAATVERNLLDLLCPAPQGEGTE